MSTVVRATPVSPAPAHTEAAPPHRLEGERRPSPQLFKYYALQSLLAGPGLVILLPIMWFRYHTLRYRFDADGMSVRWGILFRREVVLTYARIQDIHLVSNLVERWLGLGRVQIQTASGNAAAEMTIEGLPDFEEVRDQLYARMRGARETRGSALSTTHTGSGGELADVAAALQDAARELRGLREAMQRDKQ